MMICVCQRYRKAVRSSKRGKIPNTNSSCSLRSRSLRSLCNRGSLCNLCSLYSRSRGLPERSPEAIPCSPRP